MLRKIKLELLAFDSFGPRSMASFLETDRRILIDPGAALGPSRFGLPPAGQELEALGKALALIRERARKAEILTVSHYHYDHYLPDECVYAGKVLLTKHPERDINLSQKGRAKEFLSFLDSCQPARMEFADGRKFRFGQTELEFSPPVPHGGNARLGYVLMLAVKYAGEVFVHGSDVQGPQSKEAREWIIGQKPDVLVLSGFPTLFLGWRFSRKGLDAANENLAKIIEGTRLKALVLEHHLVRDKNYRAKIKPVAEAAEKNGVALITAAEFMGRKPVFLEANRKELWAKQQE